jgi:hypothetical protein
LLGGLQFKPKKSERLHKTSFFQAGCVRSKPESSLSEMRRFTVSRIRVAQPAISQTILDLEGELGVRLLLRDRRTVRLTAAGEIFRREALEILRRNQEAVRLTKRAALGEVGQLRIGFFGSAIAAFLPALVQEYHRRFP